MNRWYAIRVFDYNLYQIFFMRFASDWNFIKIHYKNGQSDILNRLRREKRIVKKKWWFCVGSNDWFKFHTQELHNRTSYCCALIEFMLISSVIACGFTVNSNPNVSLGQTQKCMPTMKATQSEHAWSRHSFAVICLLSILWSSLSSYNRQKLAADWWILFALILFHA